MKLIFPQAFEDKIVYNLTSVCGKATESLKNDDFHNVENCLPVLEQGFT